MNPAGNAKFNLSQAEGVHNLNDKCIYLTKAKKSPGQVEFRFLPEKYKDIFRAARAKEVKSLLDSGAIKILSMAESKKFLQDNPDHVLTSRYVDRWKPTEAFGVLPEEFDNKDFAPEKHPGLAPKSRWCVVGWKDPHIHQIERAAPTPLTSQYLLDAPAVSVPQVDVLLQGRQDGIFAKPPKYKVEKYWRAECQQTSASLATTHSS